MMLVCAGMMRHIYQAISIRRHFFIAVVWRVAAQRTISGDTFP